MTEVGFYPSRKLKKRGNEYFSFLNLWPFAGIMMVLLFMFLGSVRPYHDYVPTDLAVVRHFILLPFANREDSINIYVTRDGTLFFNKKRLSVDGVPGKICESVRNGSERRVYLWVEAKAKYGDVKVVLDGVRDAGIEKVALLAEQQR